MTKEGCALHHWVHDVIFNVSNQHCDSPYYVLTRFLPKCMEGFFLYTLYPYISFSFFNPFNAYRNIITKHLVGFIPVLAQFQSVFFPYSPFLLFSLSYLGTLLHYLVECSWVDPFGSGWIVEQIPNLNQPFISRKVNAGSVF